MGRYYERGLLSYCKLQYELLLKSFYSYHGYKALL